MDNCLFCKIVKGEVPSHKVWEDDKHMAFLTIFPNTDGVTVVITKDHHTSYAFDLPDQVLTELMLATKKVAKLLDKAFPDVGRTGMVFEGFGVDHIHAKLFPMHGTSDMDKWRPIESSINQFFETYPGYISSHDADRADDAKLSEIAEQIKKANTK